MMIDLDRQKYFLTFPDMRPILWYAMHDIGGYHG